MPPTIYQTNISIRVVVIIVASLSLLESGRNLASLSTSDVNNYQKQVVSNHTVPVHRSDTEISTNANKATSQPAVTVADRSPEQAIRLQSSDHPRTKQEISPIDPTHLPAQSPYCYVFLVGGVSENNPGYRGFLYTAMIASRVLRQYGSTADVLLMIQFAHTTNYTSLPEAEMLGKLRIRLQYLPQAASQGSFADVVLQKFQVFELIEYRRVLFLDADILPLNNLDYIFEMSEAGMIQPNLVVATRGEPTNAGFWLATPAKGDHDVLNQIVRDHVDPFDRTLGWGHSFVAAGDHWEAVLKTGNKWKFWCAHLDQGLLYYWVKYHKKKATLVIGERVQNWDVDENGNLLMRSETARPFDNYTKPINDFNLNATDSMAFLKEAPYRDYSHFTGKSKPWLRDFPRTHRQDSEKLFEKRSDQHLWFHVFSQLNVELGLGFNMSNWNQERAIIQKPPVGLSDQANILDGKFSMA